MQFIPLAPISSGCLKSATTDESLAEYRFQGNSLLHQPVEKQSARPGGAAVETKSEFVEVIIQMVWAYRTLVRPEQPPLEQRGHAMHSGEEFVRLLAAPLDDPHLVPVAEGNEPRIAREPVGDEGRARGQQAPHRGNDRLLR